ncbi:IS982 family transposase [Loigolactobacillus coryniformis]|uniref:IS982 family transposase n=1 Tax=Loigolactobacillus coryniformis TaxID=1610 RepID=UPI0006F19BA7|nr:IS982 family transposase [Loigolactobacillus coryniformis]KRK65952.1 transposase [Loigolactobacillus coryniformis subsp. torquens DSM 20004 = KCTC 3535]
MLNHLKFKQNRHELQVSFHYFYQLCSLLYQRYCPRSVIERRNVEHTKITDIKLLALLCLQVTLGIQSQRRFYYLMAAFMPRQMVVSRSRFNRRAQQLLAVVNTIRSGITKDYAHSGDLAIIDSLPNPLCAKVRNFRVRIFAGKANIGYNATKKMPFYGFKTHMVVTANGYILNYVITAASVHDAKVAPELISGCPCPNILADVGYVGKKLKTSFRALGYNLWTPYRSNMKGAKQHNKRQLKALRRTIESRFSILAQQFGIETNLTRSLFGFQLKIELTILVYNLGFFDFMTN